MLFSVRIRAPETGQGGVQASALRPAYSSESEGQEKLSGNAGVNTMAEQVDPAGPGQDEAKAPEAQMALAMSALAVAVVQTLHELAPQALPLEILQRKATVELTRLRQTPDAEMAVAIFRFVLDALRNPKVIAQPNGSVGSAD